MRITLLLFIFSVVFSLNSQAAQTGNDLPDVPLADTSQPSSAGFVNSFQSETDTLAPPSESSASVVGEEATSAYEGAFSSVRSQKKKDPDQEWKKNQEKTDSFDLDTMTDNAPAPKKAPVYQNSFNVKKSASAERAPQSVSESEFVDMKVPESDKKATGKNGKAADVAAEPSSAKDRKAQVLQTISDNYDQLKSCYNEGLKKTPAMRGKVSMVWTMDAKGHVGDAAVEFSDLKNKDVEKCMTQQLSGWHFPATAKTGGAKDRMSYTFQFNSEKE